MRTDMDWCHGVEGHVELRVRLTPRASRNAIGEVRNGELCVRVTAPPVDGRANRELVRLIAGILSIAPGRVSIVAGETSRSKRVVIAGLDAAPVQAKLTARV
jgi:uncharacterized protein